MSADNAFAVPVLNHWLVHAPLHCLTALVNRAAVDSSAGGASLPGLGPDAPCEREPGPKTGPFDPRLLGLIPTRACNMACVYCGFGSTPAAASMDPRLACAAVDWMAAHAARHRRPGLHVHFFGGEPLMAPGVVEAVVHRTRARAAELNLLPRLEVSTNGAYSESRAGFVGDHFDVAVLSFDGFAPVQDRHRPLEPGRGAFDLVSRTARILSRSPAALCLRVCVADDNVEQLPEITEWFCTEFRPSTIAFESLQPTPESERAGLRPPDPYRFAQRLLPAWRIALRHGVEPVYAAAAAPSPRASFCPVGDDALILHPDGAVSACYLMNRDWLARGLDLSLGRMASDGALHLDPGAVRRVRRIAADKPRCLACFCRWSCAGGCHVNHSFPGCSNRFDDFCVQTRLITACLLLTGLDQLPLLDALLADTAALRRLARWPDDRLENRSA